MKKVYSKPQVHAELLAMDQPIALNCVADFDDMQAIIDFGYFGPNDRGIPCTIQEDAVEWGNDTICYHSNVQAAFLS